MKKLNLLELFAESGNRLVWHCEPAIWNIDRDRLIITSDAETDFWQRTHYGFTADNGHFLHMALDGDFTIETRVRCDFKNQYDQAGLMIRISDACWVKTSVEYEPDEPNKLGVVVTNHGYSDWSTQDVDDSFIDFKLMLVREGSDYIVKYFSEIDQDWIQMRMFHLFDQPQVKAGLYCCSPKAGGFTAKFDYLKIEGIN